ncbi:hypothetical protein [Paraburkholderia sp. BCC1876]|nr:hypothetical protein [Paraburkholderia sp. BCC1876]
MGEVQQNPFRPAKKLARVTCTALAPPLRTARISPGDYAQNSFHFF